MYLSLPLHQPLFLPISRPDGREKSGRKRERKTGGRPVCAVAAGYSGSRHWFRSTGIFRWVVARCQGEHPRKVVVNYIKYRGRVNSPRPAFVWCGVYVRNEGGINWIVSLLRTRFVPVFRLRIRRLFEKSHFFTRQGTLHRWKQVSGTGSLDTSFSIRWFLHGVGTFFSLFFFFTLSESRVVVLSRFCWK